MELVETRRFCAANSPWGVAAVIFDIKVDEATVGRLSWRPSLAPQIIGEAGQVGYSVNPERRGSGYAGEAVRLIMDIARAQGFQELWLTCNPDNVASIRTLEKVGAIYVETVSTSPGGRYYLRGEFLKRRYRLDL